MCSGSAIEANYILRLIGTVTATDDDGIFPPEVGETTTVTFTRGLITGGKQTKHKELCISDPLDTVAGSGIEVKGRDTDLDPGP